MPTLILTDVKAIYNRPVILGIVYSWVTQNTTDANAYVDALIAGTDKNLTIPTHKVGVIATELDIAGVLMSTVTFTCGWVVPQKYNRTAFIATLTANNVSNPSGFATDVENNTARTFTGPPEVIATELDFHGVVWHI